MNKLQLKVLENKPAEVNFNYEEISNNLDIVLKKYEEIDGILNKILEDGENLKNKLDDKAVTPVVQVPSKDEEIFVDTYEIEGTEDQLNALDDFLNTYDYKWKIVSLEPED